MIHGSAHRDAGGFTETRQSGEGKYLVKMFNSFTNKDYVQVTCTVDVGQAHGLLKGTRYLVAQNVFNQL